MAPRPHECIGPCAIFRVNHAAQRQLCALRSRIGPIAVETVGAMIVPAEKAYSRYPVTENGLASVFPIASLYATRPSLRFNARLISNPRRACTRT